MLSNKFACCRRSAGRVVSPHNECTYKKKLYLVVTPSVPSTVQRRPKTLLRHFDFDEL